MGNSYSIVGNNVRERVIQRPNSSLMLQTPPRFDKGNKIVFFVVIDSDDVQSVFAAGFVVRSLMVPTPSYNWEEDYRVDACPQCGKQFGIIFGKRHHCRYCGKIFCSSCSSHTINKMRACEKCMKTYCRESKLGDDEDHSNLTLMNQNEPRLLLEGMRVEFQESRDRRERAVSNARVELETAREKLRMISSRYNTRAGYNSYAADYSFFGSSYHKGQELRRKWTYRLNEAQNRLTQLEAAMASGGWTECEIISVNREKNTYTIRIRGRNVHFRVPRDRLRIPEVHSVSAGQRGGDDQANDRSQSNEGEAAAEILRHFGVGSAVEAHWKGGRKWYSAKVVERPNGIAYNCNDFAENSTFALLYSDGDEDDFVLAENIRPRDSSNTLANLIQLRNFYEAEIAAAEEAKAQAALLAEETKGTSDDEIDDESATVTIPPLSVLSVGTRVVLKNETQSLFSETKQRDRSGIIAAARPVVKDEMGQVTVYDILFDDGEAGTGIDRKYLMQESASAVPKSLHNTKLDKLVSPKHKFMKAKSIEFGDLGSGQWESIYSDSPPPPPPPIRVENTSTSPSSKVPGVMDITLEGYLGKTGSQDNRFKERWCKLKYGALFWYDSQSDVSKGDWSGSISLNDYRIQTEPSLGLYAFTLHHKDYPRIAPHDPRFRTLQSSTRYRKRSSSGSFFFSKGSGRKSIVDETIVGPRSEKYRALTLRAKNEIDFNRWTDTLWQVIRRIDLEDEEKTQAGHLHATTATPIFPNEETSVTSIAPNALAVHENDSDNPGPPSPPRMQKQQSTIAFQKVGRYVWRGTITVPPLPLLHDSASRRDGAKGLAKGDRVEILWRQGYNRRWHLASRDATQGNWFKAR
eukprot:g4757.t1